MSSAWRACALRVALGALLGLLSGTAARGVEPWEFPTAADRALAEQPYDGHYDDAYDEAVRLLKDIDEGQTSKINEAVKCLRASIALWESSGKKKPKNFFPYFHLAVLFGRMKQYSDAKECLAQENLDLVRQNRKLVGKLEGLEERLDDVAKLSRLRDAVETLKGWKRSPHAIPISSGNIEKLDGLKRLADEETDRYDEVNNSLREGIKEILRDEFDRRSTELEELSGSTLITTSVERQNLDRDLEQCRDFQPDLENAAAILSECDVALVRARMAAVDRACGRFKRDCRPEACKEAESAWPGIARLEPVLIWKCPEIPKIVVLPPGKKKSVEVAGATVEPETPSPVKRVSEELHSNLVGAFGRYQAGDLDGAIDEARRLAARATSEPPHGQALVRATISFLLFAKWKANPDTGSEVKGWLETDAAENAKAAMQLNREFLPSPELFPQEFREAFARWTGGAP